MDAVLLKPNRKGTYASLVFGVAFAAVGIAMIASGNLVGIAAAAVGGVGLYAAVGGFVPGFGLRLDAQGFAVKSFGKSWGAEWLETASFAPRRIRVGRRADVDVVEIHYQQGVGDAHLPRHTLGKTIGIDERYVIAAYGGLSNTQLAELMERYRSSG
jgi:hypothetical protein